MEGFLARSLLANGTSSCCTLRLLTLLHANIARLSERENDQLNEPSNYQSVQVKTYIRFRLLGPAFPFPGTVLLSFLNHHNHSRCYLLEAMFGNLIQNDGLHKFGILERNLLDVQCAHNVSPFPIARLLQSSFLRWTKLTTLQSTQKTIITFRKIIPKTPPFFCPESGVISTKLYAFSMHLHTCARPKS